MSKAPEPPKKSGLALNQMIVLLHYYGAEGSYRWEDKAKCQRFGDYIRHDSYKGNISQRGLVTDRYHSLTTKQLYYAHKRLKNRGYLCCEHGEWRLLDKGRAIIEAGQPITSGPIRPLTGERALMSDSLNAYVWRALRARRRATISEIMELLPSDRQQNPRTSTSIQRWLHWLARAHIVRSLPRRADSVHLTSNGYKRYQLIRDLGPVHPIIRQRKQELYDPNTRRNMLFRDVAALS